MFHGQEEPNFVGNIPSRNSSLKIPWQVLQNAKFISSNYSTIGQVSSKASSWNSLMFSSFRASWTRLISRWQLNIPNVCKTHLTLYVAHGGVLVRCLGHDRSFSCCLPHQNTKFHACKLSCCFSHRNNRRAKKKHCQTYVNPPGVQQYALGLQHVCSCCVSLDNESLVLQRKFLMHFCIYN